MKNVRSTDEVLEELRDVDLTCLERDPDYMTRWLAAKFSSQVHEFLDDNGMSLTDLARLMGATEPSLHDILHRDEDPTLRIMARVLCALGCDMDFVLIKPGVADDADHDQTRQVS